MKTNMKIFTVLMLALTTMPCFATNPSAKTQLNALGSDKTIDESKKERDRINTSTQNLKLGGTVTLPTGTIATYQIVKSAIAQWENKCEQIVRQAGGLEADINPQGSNDKVKKQSCFIKTCDDTKGYEKKPSIDKMSCKKTSETKKQDKKKAKAQSAAEKKYESDINELIDAYNTAMKKFVSECTSNGKTFKKTGCEE